MFNWLSEKIDLVRLQFLLLQLLALTLPFSFEISLQGDNKLLFPTEPLMIFVALVVVADLLIRPGSLGDLIPDKWWLVIPFAAALLIGSVFSEMKIVSVKFTSVNLLYILIFFFTLQRLLNRRPEFFVNLLSLYTAGFLVIGLLALYRYGTYDWNPVVVKAIFQPFYKDHTIYGATAAILSAFWLSYPLKDRIMTLKAGQVMAGLAAAGAVLLSYSRAAMLSILVFLAIRILFLIGVRLWQLAALSVAGLAILLLNSQPLLDRLNANHFDSGDRQSDLIEHTLSAGNVNTDVSNRERLNRWISGLSMFAGKPATGFGPGTYQFEYIPYQKQEFMTRLSVTDPYHIPDNSGGTAHSEYVLALSESGVPGILAWLILLGGLTGISFRKRPGWPNRGYIVAGYAALSTYFFHAFFNNFLNTDKLAFLFWGLIAWICVNYSNIPSDEKRILS
ncbi:MAG: O-antigen ligase family protein [Bacteroidales bacterium]|jgi:O-antigen ligase